MQVNVYLYFNGNCEDAMNFYKDALGGTIISLSRYGDSPMPCSEVWKKKILHGVIAAGDTHLYFSDCNEQRYSLFGDNISISLNFKSEAEINKIFAAISEGGTVTMPLQETFWGARFGMCCDKYFVNWMFNYDKPKA